MKSKLIPVAIFALFATTGALAHEDDSDTNAMSLHYLEHAGDGTSAHYTGTPHAQSDAMETDWIVAESSAARGVAGPIAGQDVTPDPSATGDDMSQQPSSADAEATHAQDTDKPYAQSDAMDTAWIFAEPSESRGAAGPIGEQDVTPDPSTSGDGMSLHWIADE